MRESKVWRNVGEYFEEKLTSGDESFDGICDRLSAEKWKENISEDKRDAMVAKVREEVTSLENLRAGDSEAFLNPRPYEPGGAELRATLAYLFAEEAK